MMSNDERSMPDGKMKSLDGTTPATYAIVPPAASAKNWGYSISVQKRGNGGIIVPILDVTENP